MDMEVTSEFLVLMHSASLSGLDSQGDQLADQIRSGHGST